MTCEHFRTQLALFVYGDVSNTDGDAVRQHLDACAACRGEFQAIQRVRGLLECVPSGTAPVMSVPGLYAKLADRAEHRLRRWRWAALLALATLAGIAGLAILPRLELRIDADQLTLRWGPGPGPEQEAVPALPDVLSEPVRAVAAGQRPAAELDDQLAVLRQIVRTLARDASKRDDAQPQRPDPSRLDARLAELERRIDLRIADLERDFRTLYRVQFASRDQTERGGKP